LLATAQSFPVQVIPQVTPPPPIYFADYADASTVSSPLRVQIILNDFEIANREIRLRTFFEGGGIAFQSNDVVVGASQLFLEGVVPLVLTNVELAPYFRFENINGISPNVYGQAIPEGAYTFCFEVYDVLTGNRISQRSCATSVVFQNEPPFLISPRDKTNVEETNPQNIVFQWTPRHINVTNVEYELSIVEIWDTQVDPQQAFLSSPPVFQATTTATTYVYGPADPLFLSGKNYAWRVQAKAKQGIEEIGLFKNQGNSEIFSFSYSGNCDLPIGINHEVKGSTNANIFWEDFSTDVPEYSIRYRQKNVQDAEWFPAKTTTNELTLWDLKAGTTYEYQLSKKCNITQSDWSFTKEFTTALEFEEESVLDCGVSPDINLTNMQPLASIGSGATFKAGDFPVKILEVSGANGRFTGKGYVTLPYLKNIKVAVEFTNILINTDSEMAEGSVRTAYDADWGNILDTGDVVDVLDDMGDIFTGGDNIDYDVDFEINAVNDIKVEDGEITITGPNGETKTLDHDDGDTYQIKDANGNTYNIDEDGNITKGAEAAEGGEVTAQNTDGVSGGSGTADAPSVNEITANGVTVTFKKSSNTKYDLDIADSDFERTKYPKAQSSDGTDYYPIHKAVVDGQTEEFLAEISISNANISINDLIFKTVSGNEIETRTEGNSNVIITLKGVNSYRSEEAIVTYKDEGGKFKIAASFFIHHIKQQELVNVVVVSVNGTNQLANIEQELNSIFGKAGAQFKVSTETFSLQASDWDDNTNGKLDYDGTGLLSDYPQELKNIQQKYKQDNPSWDATAYHLFLLPNTISLTKPLSGFMPKTRQWGYIFNAHTDDALENKSSQNLVAAHELGHGVFKLPHPFQNDENKSGSGSNWLMDYNNGDQLPYAHWAAMSDESLQLFLFQDEEDSEIAGKIWFTPEWDPFSFTAQETKTIYIGNVHSRHVNGTVPGFNLNGNTYYAEYDDSGKFSGYKSNAAGYANVEKLEGLKDKDEVYLFKNNGGCNKDTYHIIDYQTYKQQSDKQSFINSLADGTVINCSKDCEEGEKFIEKYKDISNPQTQDIIQEIANLICDSPSDTLFLKEVTEKGIANLYNWQQSEYFEGNWDRSTEAFEKFRDSYKAYVDYFFAAKAYINTATDRKAIIQIAYNLSEAQLGLLTVPERLHMLRLIATGPMLGYWTSSNYNIETLAIKIIRSISYGESQEFIGGLTNEVYSIDNEPLYLLLFKRIDDFFGASNFTQLILHLTDLALNKNNIDKQAASDALIIENNAQERFVWDVQNESFLWIFNKVQDNSKILVSKAANGQIGLKQGCIDEKIYTTGYYGNTTNTICAKYAIETQLEPFDLVSLQIIKDITFVGSQGACNSEEAVICGQESLVPAIFMLFLDKKKKNAITQNIITNTLTAASIYFSGAEIMVARGALTWATLPAYADIFVTFTDPYFSGANFKNHTSSFIQRKFYLDKAEADEISDWLQVSWTIGSTVMTIDTARKLPDPEEHIKALATYKALVKSLGEAEARKLLSADPKLAEKTANGFKNVEDDLIKQGRSDELAESTKKAEDELDALLLKNNNYELGKVIKGKQNILNDAEVSGKFRQFTINLEGQKEKFQRAGTFWNTKGELNPDLVQYFSNDGKYYLKHDPRDGRVLFFEVATKKCLGFTKDQDKLFEKVLNNDYDRLIENLKQIHGYKENYILNLLKGDLQLSDTKANIVLGKWNPNAIEGISNQLGTDDVIEGLTIFKNYAFADDVLELRPGSVHLLNIPEGMYVPEAFFHEFNIDFLDMAITNKNKIEVILVTNPNQGDLLKIWNKETNKFIVNPETGLYEPSSFAKEIKYLRDRNIKVVKLRDGSNLNLDNIDLDELDWSAF